MKKFIILIAICLIISIPDWGVCQHWTYNLNAKLGIKELDKDDWEPVNNQIAYGILLDFRQETWPVNIAIDILHSTDDGIYNVGSGLNIKEELSTLELDLGLRKIWAPKTLRPFVGGGVAFVTAKYEGSFGSGVTRNYYDSVLGIWINGGLYWTIKKFNIGFDLRWSKADITLLNEKVDAGGIHYGLIAGLHW